MWSLEDAKNLEIDKIWDLYREHVNPSQVKLIGTFTFGKDVASSSEGCWITLNTGRKILDLTGGIGVLNHGHNHPRILAARKKFAEEKRMEVHKSFFSPYVAALGANVSEMLQGKLPYSYFPNSGAESVEGALKIAYKYHEGKRNVVLHAGISFHGKLLGAAGITGSPEIHFKYPTIPNTESFEFNNIQSLTSKIEALQDDSGDSQVYAMILEPLNASTMQTASPEFLLAAREICDINNIVLIFDEVYSGWGKTGYLFNFMRVEGRWPDVLTYAKSFGGGKASISGYSYSSKIASAYDSLSDATLHSTTYYGFGEETATAIEAVNIIKDEDLVKRSYDIGVYFQSLFTREFFPNKMFIEIRGSGALWGLMLNKTYVESAIRIIQKSFSNISEIFDDPRFSRKVILGAIVNHLYEEYGVLTYIGVNVENPLIISFPLIASNAEIDLAYEAIKKTTESSLSIMLMKFLTLKAKNL